MLDAYDGYFNQIDDCGGDCGSCHRCQQSMQDQMEEEEHRAWDAYVDDFNRRLEFDLAYEMGLLNTKIGWSQSDISTPDELKDVLPF